MHTLARYRKCFETCGIKLPDGYALATTKDFNCEMTRVLYGVDIDRLPDEAALRFCRTVAEDYLFENPNAAVCFGCDHDSLITAVYRVAGKDEGTI